MDVEAFVKAVRRLSKDADRVLASLRLAPGQFAVNVHSYALRPYEDFLRRYHDDRDPRVGAIAMNPGRNGAVQTGLPFTDREMAESLVPGYEARLQPRDGRVPAGGREMSGRRLLRWGLARFGSTAALHRNVLFYITCPIAVMTEDPVRNVPLPALGREDRRLVMDLIVRHVAHLLDASSPTGVMLLGRYGEQVWSEAGSPRWPASTAPHPAARITPDAFEGAMDAAYEQARAATF